MGRHPDLRGRMRVLALLLEAGAVGDIIGLTRGDLRGDLGMQAPALSSLIRSMKLGKLVMSPEEGELTATLLGEEFFKDHEAEFADESLLPPFGTKAIAPVIEPAAEPTTESAAVLAFEPVTDEEDAVAADVTSETDPLQGCPQNDKPPQAPGPEPAVPDSEEVVEDLAGDLGLTEEDFQDLAPEDTELFTAPRPSSAGASSNGVGPRETANDDQPQETDGHEPDQVAAEEVEVLAKSKRSRERNQSLPLPRLGPPKPRERILPPDPERGSLDHEVLQFVRCCGWHGDAAFLAKLCRNNGFASATESAVEAALDKLEELKFIWPRRFHEDEPPYAYVAFSIYGDRPVPA